MTEIAMLIDRQGRTIGAFHVEAEWRAVEYYGVAYTRREDGTFREDSIIHINIMDKADV